MWRLWLPEHLSRALVLRASYAAILVLLVFSGIEAYRLQGAHAESQIASYQRYHQTDAAATTIRRALWLGSTSIRDYLLSPRPDRGTRFQGELRRLRHDCEEALHVLERLEAANTARFRLRSLVNQHLGTVERLLQSMPADAAAAYEIVQLHVVPNRQAASNALQAFLDTARRELQEDERTFAAQQRASSRKLTALLISSVLLGLLVAIFTLRYSERLEGENRLHLETALKTMSELETLSARLLEIQEEERRRLSQELHDEVGQILTALRMEITRSLQGTGSFEERERLQRARDLAERAVRMVRDISLLLRPALLDDLGLAPALQWHLEEFSRRSGVRTVFEHEGPSDSLPDPVKTCVYRITQEALNNCEKYAYASEVQVQLRVRDGVLALDIVDDGIGIPAAQTRRACTGTGILGMRERVTRLCGSFSIESQSSGTRISATIPLTAQPVAPLAAAL